SGNVGIRSLPRWPTPRTKRANDKGITMDSRIRAGLATIVLAAVALSAAAVSHAQAPKKAASPIAYTADGKLQFPADYRTWVYLSSGMDMSYSEGAGGANQHLFDNVF